jgi:hypothetical protein
MALISSRTSSPSASKHFPQISDNPGFPHARTRHSGADLDRCGHGLRGSILWVRCKVWHPLAEKTEPLLSKGCMVAVSGRPQVHPYSRRDGSPGAELIVHAEEIQVLDGEESAENEAAA